MNFDQRSSPCNKTHPMHENYIVNYKNFPGVPTKFQISSISKSWDDLGSAVLLHSGSDHN